MAPDKQTMAPDTPLHTENATKNAPATNVSQSNAASYINKVNKAICKPIRRKGDDKIFSATQLM